MEPSGPVGTEAGGILEIDLTAIVENWRFLAGRAAPAACAAVVKADAYGCGAAPVARALAGAGCETFFVAHSFEGRQLRQAVPGAIIYVLNGLVPGRAAAYAAHDLRPVLGNRAEWDEWLAYCAGSGWGGGAALHVDTGMNRLGFSEDEIADAVGTAERARITLLMSHFACADEPAHPLNAEQLRRFAAVRALFPNLPASLANSAGIFLDGQAAHDLVRPGIALYGGNPVPGRPSPMRSVVTLAGRIVQVRSVAPGQTVGYGATWTAGRPSRIAVVSIGYADGFLRRASAFAGSQGADAIVAGRRCPLVGRISMDLMAIDVTDVAEAAAPRGDTVHLLDDQIGVDEVAARAGTIGYEILTALGGRYARVYRGD